MAIWRARDTFTIITTEAASTDFSVPTANGLYTEVWSAISAPGALNYMTPTMKNLEFKTPNTETEEIKLLGKTAGAINSELNESDPDRAELSGTMVYGPTSTNLFDLEKYKLTGTTTSGATSYNYATLATNNLSVAIRFAVATSEVTATAASVFVDLGMYGCVIEELGPVKMEADGHGERDFKISTLAKNAYTTYKSA